MDESTSESDDARKRIIERIIDLQREYHFENTGKKTERQRKLREIIEDATSVKDA